MGVSFNRKFILKNILKYEAQLLSAFSKYLPYEKGFVIHRVENYLRELQNLTPDEVEIIETFYSNFRKLLSIQKANFLRYLAFLFSIHWYELELKRLEYFEKDFKRGQLIDERLLNVARALSREFRRGRKPKKRKKLEELKGEILKLKDEGLSYNAISKYLWKTHRLKVSNRYLSKVFKEWEKERERL
jgi:hypothetical protein